MIAMASLKVIQECEESIHLKDKFDARIEIIKTPIQCSCLGFYQSSLPCEHICFCISKGMISYSESDIPEKYIISSEPIESPPPQQVVIKNITKEKKPKTKNQKFKALQPTLMSICDIISNFGTAQFNKYFKYFEDIENQLRSSGKVACVDKNDLDQKNHQTKVGVIY